MASRRAAQIQPPGTRIAPTVNFHKSYHSAADSRHEHCFDDLAGEHRSEMDETYHPFSEYFRLLYC
jgi:hypothetical protein